MGLLNRPPKAPPSPTVPPTELDHLRAIRENTEGTRHDVGCLLAIVAVFAVVFTLSSCDALLSLR